MNRSARPSVPPEYWLRGRWDGEQTDAASTVTDGQSAMITTRTRSLSERIKSLDQSINEAAAELSDATRDTRRGGENVTRCLERLTMLQGCFRLDAAAAKRDFIERISEAAEDDDIEAYSSLCLQIARSLDAASKALEVGDELLGRSYNEVRQFGWLYSAVEERCSEQKQHLSALRRGFSDSFDGGDPRALQLRSTLQDLKDKRSKQQKSIEALQKEEQSLDAKIRDVQLRLEAQHGQLGAADRLRAQISTYERQHQEDRDRTAQLRVDVQQLEDRLHAVESFCTPRTKTLKADPGNESAEHFVHAARILESCSELLGIGTSQDGLQRSIDHAFRSAQDLLQQSAQEAGATRDSEASDHGSHQDSRYSEDEGSSESARRAGVVARPTVSHRELGPDHHVEFARRRSPSSPYRVADQGHAAQDRVPVTSPSRRFEGSPYVLDVQGPSARDHVARNWEIGPR